MPDFGWRQGRVGLYGELHGDGVPFKGTQGGYEALDHEVRPEAGQTAMEQRNGQRDNGTEWLQPSAERAQQNTNKQKSKVVIVVGRIASLHASIGLWNGRTVENVTDNGFCL